MPAKPGDAFTLQAPPYHRYIVLTSPDDNGEVLITNLTTISEVHPEQGCVLQTSDYPAFIKKPTTVRFNSAKMVPADKIVPSEALKINESISVKALQKIREAAISPSQSNLSGKYQDLIRRELGESKGRACRHPS